MRYEGQVGEDIDHFAATDGDRIAGKRAREAVIDAISEGDDVYVIDPMRCTECIGHFDGHGRLLAHVFVTREGKDVLFAEALVRAGLSPYFAKYGRSRRFDAALVAAQHEAREAKRGIWGAELKHYPDYDERLVWWESRAKQVDAWRIDAKKPENAATFVELGVATDSARLASLLGKTVTVFGSLDHVEVKTEPKRILLVDQPHRPFPLVIFDGPVWAGIELAPIEASFVRVTGTLSEYRGRIQMKIDDPKAISTK